MANTMYSTVIYCGVKYTHSKKIPQISTIKNMLCQNSGFLSLFLPLVYLTHPYSLVLHDKHCLLLKLYFLQPSVFMLEDTILNELNGFMSRWSDSSILVQGFHSFQHNIMAKRALQLKDCFIISFILTI